MKTLNEVVRSHELSAEWGHQEVCAQFLPISRALTKEYFPGLQICYFRCESMPAGTLARYNGINGVGAKHDFTLNS
jgi:hypothetical protein